jgi:biopolymer transport protein ExbD
MMLWHEEPRKKARIEIIPMIDVMMFLLVFFVLISLHVIPALGLKTQLPGATQLDRLEIKRHLVVTVASGGRLQLDGADYSLEALLHALTTLKRQSPDIDVVINGDKDALVQNLVDVMDAAKSAGIASIAIAANRK